MVRLIGLISVFGIVAFCLAALIDGSSSYAQALQAACPCWDGSPGNYHSIDEAIAGSGDITYCDTLRQLNANPDPDIPTYMQASILTTYSGVYARIDPHQFHDSPGQNRHTECCSGIPCSFGGDHPAHQNISLSEAQACMQDILAYCRDYCMANPDSNLCSQ